MNNTAIEKYIITLYDGECGFCDHWVRWILRQRPSQNIRFVALQSDQGRELLQQQNIEFDLKSIVVIHQNKSYQKSKAIALILKNINSSFRHFSLLFQIIPTIIADAGYDFVAKYRYNIIGKNDSCEIPSPEQRKFFLT